jgi:hypothetical protein
MKKTVCFKGVLLLLSLLILAGCATLSQKPERTPLTLDSVPGLKGQWFGTAVYLTGETVPTLMEIYNDTVPIEGKINMTSVPVRVQDRIPAGMGGSSGTAVIEFRKGTITDQGTLLIITGESVTEFSLYTEGTRPRLEGWFYYYGAKGNLTLYKK